MQQQVEYLQSQPLPSCRFAGFANQGFVIKEGGSQHTLNRRSALPVRGIHRCPAGQQQPHEIWPGFICCHMYGPYVLVVSPEVLACTSYKQHQDNIAQACQGVLVKWCCSFFALQTSGFRLFMVHNNKIVSLQTSSVDGSIWLQASLTGYYSSIEASSNSGS